MRRSAMVLFAVIWLLPISAALTQTTWEKYPGNPILEPGPPGSWDEMALASCVIIDDNIYKMWYIGYDGATCRIGYAISPNGIEWTRADSVNPVLSVGPAGSFDDQGVTSPWVIYDGNIYKMWYSGYDGSGSHTDRIGYATSQDGITWQKADGINPVMGFGPAAWENRGVWGSRVIFDGQIYKMWYAGWNESNVRIGCATSLDGTNWIKSRNNPILNIGAPGSWDDSEVNDPMVIFADSTYHMWYLGYDYSGASGCIGYATSPDGIIWEKADNSNPVLEPGSYGSFDDLCVRSPMVLLENDVYKMWYISINHDIVWGTGYATDSSITDIETNDLSLPKNFKLSQNYPNPFNAQTKIAYSLNQRGDISIDIFDILGRKIETIVEGMKPAGNHQALWDAGDQASGVYFYKIKGDNLTETKKMILVK
jgi:predicted GH43/DUF377 family glycosyl hydrolase